MLRRIPDRSRRALLMWSLIGAARLAGGRRSAAAQDAARRSAPERVWFEAALAMRRRAESWGDQAYGAVLVLDGVLVGEGPSRVVARRDPTAHAEREAIRDARERLRRANLAGSVLYSTSRPCRSCESAAAEAGVARMVFGESLIDAGPPRR